MIAEVKIIKELPKEQIEQFIDKTVYNTVVLTREYTKSENAFPYLTGELMRQEISLPISKGYKSYSLLDGVDYAKYVWNYNNVKWTNPSTQPQWYLSTYEKDGASILSNAVARAIKELK